MTFTPLHRALGLPPSRLTNEILDCAIDAAVLEGDDIDWKSELPPTKGLSQTDIPKDIAAMANRGGGMIVYGVTEDQRAATGRVDVGEFTEMHERALHSVAITAISPPVFGLEVHRLGDDPRAVAVIVPASVDGPHLIYRGEYFGAPLRNDADTVWMKEREIAAAYRARFDEQRRSSAVLDQLYDEAVAGRDISARAWLVAVAHPRIPRVARPDRDAAREIFNQAEKIVLTYSTSSGVHPLASVDRLNPRPGLRRWVAPNSATGNSSWREAHASIHHDGSVTLATAIGGHRSGTDGNHASWEVEARGIEAAVADFAGLLRATAQALHHSEYDVRVGIEWTGSKDLTILTIDNMGHTYDGASTPLATYTPVGSTIDASASDAAFHRQVHQLAQDCVNQGGITNLHVIQEPKDGPETDGAGPTK